MESILTSIKKLLGIKEEYNNFDQDIIMHINTVLVTLNQLGVGPSDGFEITDELDNWSDFVGDNEKLLNNVKSYIYLRVRLLFDPPLSSSLIEAMNRQIAELEWRIAVIAYDLSKKE